MAKNFSSFLNALRRRKCGNTSSRLLLLVKLPFSGVRTSSLLNKNKAPRFDRALFMAERGRFELPVPVRVQLISSQPHSTTLPSLHESYL